MSKTKSTRADKSEAEAAHAECIRSILEDRDFDKSEIAHCVQLGYISADEVNGALHYRRFTRWGSKT